MLGNYDLVALQEADGGSLRSGYVNQVEHLAHLGAFPYWYQQLNRNLGRFAQHSNGCLAAWSPRAWRTTRYLGRRDAARSCCVLARARTRWWCDDAPGTRRRRRARQLAYIRDLIGDYRHQVLMGDMNTHANDLLENSPLRDLGLLAPQVEATFPSWRPQRCLDHILLSPSLTLNVWTCWLCRFPTICRWRWKFGCPIPAGGLLPVQVPERK